MFLLRASAPLYGRTLALAFIWLLITSPFGARAMDQIMLKNGTRVFGTILAQSKDRVIMRIGQGNVVFPKKTVWRIYEDITDQLPITRVLKRDELPPWWILLSDLYHEDWVNSLKSISPTPIAETEFRNVPYLSFRANTIYEMNIYGDPLDPAGLEVGYYGNLWFASREAQKRCRQFLASYLTGLKQLQTVYRLNAMGGRETISGLTIEITPRSSKGSYKGWWVTVWNSRKLAASQCTEATWKRMCEKNLIAIQKFTAGKIAWTKYSIRDAAKRYLPLERMEER